MSGSKLDCQHKHRHQISLFLLSFIPGQFSHTLTDNLCIFRWSYLGATCRTTKVLVIFTARNSSCGKVMFLQVSVCPQRGLYPACNRAGGCVSQHAIGKGVCDQGVRQGVCDWGVYTPTTTINKRAICILLECFLVEIFCILVHYILWACRWLSSIYRHIFCSLTLTLKWGFSAMKYIIWGSRQKSFNKKSYNWKSCSFFVPRCKESVNTEAFFPCSLALLRIKFLDAWARYNTLVKVSTYFM